MLRFGTFSRSFGTFSRLSGRAAGILGDRGGIVFPEVEVDDPQLGRLADQFHGAVDAQLAHDAGPVVFG
jgi:hypothetical protein